jgi:hypothetical protein
LDAARDKEVRSASRRRIAEKSDASSLKFLAIASGSAVYTRAQSAWV